MSAQKVVIGDRVRMVSMPDDPDPIKPGEEGTVHSIDDAQQIHVKWDSGHTLAMIPGVDSFEILAKPTDGYKQITEDQFHEVFKPIQNTLNNNASFGGQLYETFGAEYNAVLAQFDKDPGTVWTIIDSDGVMTYTLGMHYVNRMGYLITEVSANSLDEFKNAAFIDVELDGPDDEDDIDDDLDEEDENEGDAPESTGNRPKP